MKQKLSNVMSLSKCLSLLMLLTIFSCKKKEDTPITPPVTAPTNFAEIKMSDVQAKETNMITTQIFAVSSGTAIWQPNEVFVFKTNEGRYGKFQIVAALNAAGAYKLTINATTYNTDGSVKITNAALVINDLKYCDLDLLVETNVLNTTSDFQWEIFPINSFYCTLKNGAKIVKYTF